MVELLEKKNDIILLLFWFNVAISLLLIFYFNKTIFIVLALINILCLGSFLIIARNTDFFENVKKYEKLTKSLNKKLDNAYGKVPR